MHRQTIAVPLCMCSGFPTGRLEQMIVTSLYDIMGASHVIMGGNYKRRTQLSLVGLAAAVTVIWVF